MSNLGRSLSLNTGSSLFGGAATTSQPQQGGGLFGNAATSQPAQSGGLFGSTPASQPAQPGGLFGSTPASQPQQASGGLFGAGGTTSAQTSKPFQLGAPPAGSQAASSAGGGLFGASAAAATTQPAAGGLFGAAQPAASKPGGLFGSTMGTSAPATGGLFGGAAPAASAAPSGGLFGSTPAAPKPGGLFGASTATPQPATGGLFGGAAASTQPASGGLFGAKPAAAPAGGLFGQPQPAAQQPAPSSSLFGALNNATSSTTAQPQQSVPAIKIDWSNVKPTTRFNELHNEVQEAIVFIDNIIQGAMRASMQCSEAIPALGRQLDALPADVEYLDRRLETVEGALGRDAVAVGQGKEVAERDNEDAVRLFRTVENLKLPNQFHYATIGSSNFPTNPSDPTPDASTTTDLLSYFSTRALELEGQAKTFEKHQREVDAHLRTVEYSAVEGLRKLGRARGAEEEGDRVGEGLREIAGVMRTFEEAILRVAERVGEGREGVVNLELGGVGR